jgi:hypothetical protein
MPSDAASTLECWLSLARSEMLCAGRDSVDSTSMMPSIMKLAIISGVRRLGRFLPASRLARLRSRAAAKAVVYGACHADALRACLARDKRVSEVLEFLPLKACFEMSERDVARFETEIAPNLDVFIYQPVSGKRIGQRFASASLLEFLRPDCITISFQYLHFELYTPFVNYPSRAMGPSPFDYLDYTIVEAYLGGLSPERAVDRAAVIKLSDEMLEQVQTQVFTELRKRETGETGPVDITLTDFIEANYRDYCLFHTINHPTGILFSDLSERVLDHLHQFGFAGPRDCVESSVDLDPLNETHFPCPTRIYEQVGLTFRDEAFRYHRKAINPLEGARRTYRYLEREGRQRVEDAIDRLASKRPWFRGALDVRG